MRSPSIVLFFVVALAAAACAACSGDGDAAADEVPGGGDGDGGGGGDGAAGGDDASAGGSDGGDAAPLPPPEHGLRAELYEDFTTSKIVRYDPTVDFELAAGKAPGAGVRAESWSARWLGTIEVPSADAYTFSIRSDDGVRVWIDGKLVVDDWKMQSPTETSSAPVQLAPGKRYDVKLEYFQYVGGAMAHLSWATPSHAKEIVPTSALRPPASVPAGLKAPRPTFQNAVVKYGCPDPGILKVDGTPPTYVMVCTGGSFPIRTSNDLVTWKDSGSDILPTRKAPWAADGGRNWAPEIHKIGAQYVAYFTASGPGSRLMIGAAHAASPTGPWTAEPQPLVQHPTMGVIDATQFTDDDGKHYLYWKIDGNAVGQPTPIFVRELRADGLAFAAGSTAVQVLTNDPSTWEGGVVEAPWVIKRNGSYYLFYSGNVYDERYATGVARSSSPKGPFTKKGAPILKNNADWVGPGHGSVVVGHDDADFFFHHAWPTNGAGVRDAAAGRWGLIERVVWTGGWPTFAGSTSDPAPQAWP